MSHKVAVFLIVFFAEIPGWQTTAQAQQLLKSTVEEAPVDSSKAFMSLVEELRDPFSPHLPPVPVPVRPVEAQPAYHYSPPVKPVPVVQPVIVKVSAPQLDINGLIWGRDKDEQQVIIGGKIFSVGDTVQGAKIMGVSRKGVVIMYKGSRFTLNPDTDLKKTGESQ